MQIYLTENLINGKKYIGKDSKSDPNYLGSGILLKKAILKYGKENFSKRILEDNITNINELSKKEIYYIELFNAVKDKLFYNIADGGSGGDNFTNHPDKENIRKKCILNYKLPVYSEELRKKLSDLKKIKIYKFDKNGIFLKKYESIEDAAINNNIKNKGNICLVADNKRNYAGGFRWSYHINPMPLLYNKIGRKSGTKNTYKLIRQHTNIQQYEIYIYDISMKLLHTVIGYREAANITGLDFQMINKKCLSGEFYKGYYFKKGNKTNTTIRNEIQQILQ